MKTWRFGLAILLAPVFAVIVGPLFSAYLAYSLNEPFAPRGLINTIGAFGVEAVFLAYIATALCTPVAIYISRRRRSRPTLRFTILCGAITGTITPELIPWVWFLQGPIGSPLFFVYLAAGAVAGSLVAAVYWGIVFSHQPVIRAA